VSPRRLRRAGVLVAMALAFGASGGCGGSSGSGADTLVLTGSSTIAPLVAELAQRYEGAHPGVRIDVQTGGSSRGIQDVRNGLADIGMVSRALEGEEERLHVHPIARDGVAIILNARNPVWALGEAQVAAIYRGEIESWAEVGGRDAPIVVVHKAEGRATLEVFLAHFGLDHREIRPDVIVGENAQATKTVAANADAVGYVSIGSAAVDIEHGVPIKLLEVGGVPATLGSVRRGAYPITRPLYLVTREPAHGLARAFIDYARSPAAAPTFEAQAFVQAVE
jgi:phosphate transport system substrate-binding protein